MLYRVLACTLLFACGDSLPPPSPAPARIEVTLVPTTPNRAVDLLFVIDDSVAFLDTQRGFYEGFPAFLDELAALPGGLPDLHVGVVTSDVGALGSEDTQPGAGVGSGAGECHGTGKNGELQTNSIVNGAFISDIAAPDGSRTTNYSGSLADAFAAIAAVGSTGCGFEQHLAAARRALDGNPVNAGFLRPDATLAIIVLTDEDDCSFVHSTFLDPDDALGPVASFRCTRFGVLCEGGGQTPDGMTTSGQKLWCHANEESPYLVHLADFEMFFKGLKSDPRTVMMATVSGPATPFDVEPTAPPGGATQQPTLREACSSFDAIDPSVRLPELARRFAHQTTENVCTMDFHPAHASLARHVRNLLGDACIPQAIATPADCVVADQRADGSETALPACPAAGDCYTLVDDAACTASGLRLEVTRGAAPPADTMVAVRCAL